MTTAAAGNMAGHPDKDKDKEKEKPGMRRALGRGLASLLPGPRAVPPAAPPVAAPSASTHASSGPAAVPGSSGQQIPPSSPTLGRRNDNVSSSGVAVREEADAPTQSTTTQGSPAPSADPQKAVEEGPID